MRNGSSKGTHASAGKQSRAQNQKELRQAQRQQYVLQDADLTYSTVQAPRTVKNSNRMSYAGTSGVLENPTNLIVPAGPSSSNMTPIGQNKSSLQAARSKLLGHAGPQSSNLFGGLSRHVINASACNGGAPSSSQKPVASSTVQAHMTQHSRQGSTGYLYSSSSGTKHPQNVMPSQNASTSNMQTIKQYSQHNANYHQTVPTSPTGIAMHPSVLPKSNRTLAALESMNQTQLKMRKSESQSAQKQQHASQQHITSVLPKSMAQSSHLQQQLQQRQVPSAMSSTQRSKVSGATKGKSGAQQDRHVQKQQSQPAHQQQLQQHYMTSKQAHTQARNHFLMQGPTASMREESYEFSEHQRSSTTLLKMQPQPQPLPQPHNQFLGSLAALNENSEVSDPTFAKHSSLINQQLQELSNFQNKRGSQGCSLEPSIQERTGSFVKETDNPEIDANPELTSPLMSQEDPNNGANESGSGNNRGSALPPRVVGEDVAVQATLCCHELTKQNAVLTQKNQFLGQQIKEEKDSFKMKEQQFNKMITALKRTHEENLKKAVKQIEKEDGKSQSGLPGQKDWKDTLDELSKKKEQVNSLEERVLELELKAEKVALDHKLALQAKEDEVGEERLKVRHKESDLRQANAQIERLNEDIQGRIQEALDRQSDRLANEKKLDLDSVNKRNEQLIKQLVESHSEETRRLRELLLGQERKTREAEYVQGNLEFELRNAKLEQENKFDPTEIEEIQLQTQQVNEIRINNLRGQFQEENKQLRDVIGQLELHITQLQESKSESDRKLIIADDKIGEVKKEAAKNKILVAAQKEKEEKMQLTFKAQIAKERKTADMAVTKMKGVQKLEAELNKKQITINQLRGKILEMEREEMHKGKILLMKRKQIEDEKTVLIKKQAMRQRSMTRTNLSATRLQQQLENKQAVIATERESKRALQQEKSKLEKEIATIKREKTVAGGGDSSRHNESMSMYFARSQGLFSPRNAKGDVTNKSMLNGAFAKSKTSRHQVFMSQQQLDRKEFYLSKQSSGERTSSIGGGSLQGGDSMVNIVEFEENISPKSRGRRVENNSILSTPFKHDEPNESKITNLNFRSKTAHSQSMLAPHTEQKDSQLPKEESFYKQGPMGVGGAGVAQFQTHNIVGDAKQHFKNPEGKKIAHIQDNEAEFIQVLSGCDSDNESERILKNLPGLKNAEKKTPAGSQAVRKSKKPFGQSGKAQGPRESGAPLTQRDLKEIKLMQSQSVLHPAQHPQNQMIAQPAQGSAARGSQRTRMQNSQSFISKGNSQLQLGKASPSKLHLNMASMLAEQRMINSKESFVRTVLTARQECEQFNSTIRAKDEHALSNRRKSASFKGNSVGDHTDPHHQTTNPLQIHTSFDEKGGVPATTKNFNKEANGAYGKTANIRQMNRQKTNSVASQKEPATHLKRVQSTKTSGQIDEREMAARESIITRKNVTDATPESVDERLLLAAMQSQSRKDQADQINQNESFNQVMMQRLVNMTSSIENNSQGEDQSQQSNRLAEENAQLKEQLDLVKRSLAAHQEKAATSEVTMMDAILQMKEQIQQVMVTGSQQQPVQQPLHSQRLPGQGEEKPRRSRVSGQQQLQQQQQHLMTQKRHDDYMVTSRISRNSFDEHEVSTIGGHHHTAVKSKKVRSRVPESSSLAQNGFQESVHSENQSSRKTNSVHMRQRSETLDLTQAQAESVYKKIKIKSPNKRNNQGSSAQLQASLGSQGNFQKQTTSSAMKRASMDKQQLQLSAKNASNNVSSFYQQQQQAQQQSLQPMGSSLGHPQQFTSQSFYQTTRASQSKQNRLSMGVLKHSAQQNARNKVSASKHNSSSLVQSFQPGLHHGEPDSDQEE